MRAAVIGRNSSLAYAFLLLLAGMLCISSATLAAADKPRGSIGLHVVPTVTGELVVLNVVPGAPAQVAGLHPGDLILQIDDFVLAGSDFTEVVPRYIWGPVGSSVTIIYLRPGESGRHRLTLKRAEITKDIAPPPGVELLRPENK